ncbi:uncharacterized protein EHS24_005045 [Apiotrichum porosum]|uniref:Uncharacterized protein n=1 Tax=Apiotrichum porosum TaxID=105984 RepID=A0A427Y6Q0_9TREE|nr:uncharacterized protein EHS24_005045 [Apiotrichum porosum]RSH86773.1 hypothetical protein EHS24_005045 [Apiotrichum porosum]
MGRSASPTPALTTTTTTTTTTTECSRTPTATPDLGLCLLLLVAGGLIALGMRLVLPSLVKLRDTVYWVCVQWSGCNPFWDHGEVERHQAYRVAAQDQLRDPVVHYSTVETRTRIVPGPRRRHTALL